MDRSSDNLGQTISNIQRDLEELKSNQGQGGGGGGGGGEEYFAGNGIEIDMGNTISIDTDVVATKTDLDDYAELSDLATVATSGSYNDLLNKPTIPDPADYYWANVKVSSSSSNYAKPSFDQTTYPNSTYPHIIGNGSLLYMSADGNASGGYNIVLDKNQPSFSPTNASSGLLDLGKSYSKWKDLYLAGDLYLPGDIKKGDYTTSFQNKSGTLALTSDVDSKVDIQSVVLDNQKTTILAQVKALGAAKKSYGRFTCTYDGASANISDRPTRTTNASFVCVAYASRLYTESSYTYQLLCWVQANENPYKAVVTHATTSISWSRLVPTVNDGTLTVTQNGTTAGTFTANQSSNATIALTDTTYSDMVGATLSADGEGGLVPAPSAGDQDKFLRGDGTWTSVTPGGGEDTGWVDLTQYIENTYHYAARSGQPPRARRINGIVYLAGEIYCKIAVGVMSSTLLANLPAIFKPSITQVSGSGVCYELSNSYYMIYAEQTNNSLFQIRISQPYTKIPQTNEWQGYSLSAIPPYPGA